ncbi:S-adenosyl-methyltransferase MraW [Plasmodium vivax North Korean]|uniref:S-adenosyl-methyltransferase MraW n=1 Tax=Plasmodium vivax North Korean TaxID=1035514 RepID=A0A0J9TMG9_PLAVI|nr:S-adenosyl-methyltransferase MraW [Plasmodium vivax North Korean]
MSTDQLNDPNRTFSYNSKSSLLDFRYGVEGKKAHHILNTYSLKDLTRMFKKYGEIKQSEYLARLILQKREISPVNNVNDLKEICEEGKFLYRGRNKNPLKLIFQSLRIECNNELEVLKFTLKKVPEMLKIQGRLLIISFHSLEDEVILKWARSNSQTLKIPDLAINIMPLIKACKGSPFLPSRSEIEVN